MRGQAKQKDLVDQLHEIAGMGRSACMARWQKAFNSPPPKNLSTQFLQRVLAQDLQCRQLGGHTAAIRRTLRAVLRVGGDEPSIPIVNDGAILVREWNGRTYRVEVGTAEYLLDGKSYKSLSAVAKHITGAKWSGPRFFGLTPKRRA